MRAILFCLLLTCLLAAEQIGVSVVHIETGRKKSTNGGARFPMMSVFKLPIALEILHQSETGKLSLDRTIEMRPSDFRPGLSPLAERFPKGTSVSIRELLRWMVVESDNAACDKLIEIAGGPAAVQRRMRELGISDIDISLSELDMWQRYSGIAALGPTSKFSLDYFSQLAASISQPDQLAAARRFSNDRRNTASPAAMTDLWIKIHRGETLSKEGTALLMEMLTATVPGARRLRCRLPPGTTVAHRPGTSGVTAGIAAATNDTGIVTLPHGKGHLAIAVFVKDSDRDLASREDRIANIARAEFDMWMTR